MSKVYCITLVSLSIIQLQQVLNPPNQVVENSNHIQNTHSKYPPKRPPPVFAYHDKKIILK